MNLNEFTVALADAMILIYTFVKWVKFRRVNPDVRVHFRLIELWAVTLSLSPALALFGFMLRFSPRAEQQAPFVLALLVPHQVCACWLAIVRNHDDAGSARVAARQSTRDHFVYIFISSLFGILFPLLPLSILLLVFLAYIMFPYSVVPALYILNLYQKSRENQNVLPLPRPAPRPKPPQPAAVLPDDPYANPSPATLEIPSDSTVKRTESQP